MPNTALTNDRRLGVLMLCQLFGSYPDLRSNHGCSDDPDLCNALREGVLRKAFWNIEHTEVPVAFAPSVPQMAERLLSRILDYFVTAFLEQSVELRVNPK